MLDPQAPVSIGQLVSTLKDGAFLVGICVAGWKARSIIQPGIEFFKRCNAHMDTMEHGMKVILENHLSHMENDLRSLAGRRHDYIDVNESPVTPVYETYAEEQREPDIVKEV